MLTKETSCYLSDVKRKLFSTLGYDCYFGLVFGFSKTTCDVLS